MDIYRFFNSKDVASYLRGIGYEFSMPEASFIVYCSLGATLDEKMVAWLEIAETMPDCAMEKRPWLEQILSTRAFLSDYVDLKRRELGIFCGQDGSIFRCQYEESGFGWQDDGSLFSSFETCISHMRERWADGADSSISGFRVTKSKMDQPDHGCDDLLYLNRDMEVTDVACATEDGTDLDCKPQFDGMWFAIPVPFRRGDIVRDARHTDSGPFVLDWLPTWGKAEFLANGFCEGEQIVERADWRLAHWLKDGDVTDMICGGYDMGDDGVINRDHSGWIYLDLEYADALPCEHRWAEVVSAHLKKEIDFDEVQGLLRFLQIDNEARWLRERYDRFYDERYYPDGVWQRIKR